MLNTPWWAWLALANAAAVLWLAVSHLDEMTPGPDAPRWFVLVFRGIAVLCCLVLGTLIVLAKVLGDRRVREERALRRFDETADDFVRALRQQRARDSARPPGCASAAGEAPRAPQKVAP